jgi:DNA-directed RNA polymerase subunit RPC12/RpoP
MMWECLDCGEEFEVPVGSSIPCVDDWDTGVFIECPNCGSDDINEL